MRIGFGYDSHRLVEGRNLIIGGVKIPYGKGMLGHSDADVLCHAITDAIIGALGIGDIGQHFPDTNPQWKDASSVEFLHYILELTTANSFEVAWIDTTVLAEEPKLSPYIELMKQELSRWGIPPGRLNIKAKTNEGMGFVGSGEGIVAYAVCLLKRFPDPLNAEKL
jgi:2-C-methyl-D-erythritol 2,4-cyclodiphosphate synthase